MIVASSSNWNSTMLTNVAEIVMGQAPESESYNTDGRGVPLIAGAADLGEIFPKPKKFTTAPVKRSRKGDIILCVRATIGDLNWADKEYCYGRGVAGIRPNSKINPEFLFHWLALNADYLRSIGRGATFKQISKTDITDLRVPLPPPDEQRRIVGRIKKCLSRVDEIKRLREETRQEAAAVFPSLLSYVFDDVQEKSVSTTIGDVAIETRYGTSNKCHLTPIGVPILRIPNVANGEVNLDDMKYCQLTSAEEDKLLLQPGDLLVVRTNGSPDLVGRCAVVNFSEGEKFGFASYLIRIRVDQSKVNPSFLSYFLTSSHGRKAIAAIRRTAAGQYNVNSENLRAITLPLPDRELQDELVDRMSEQREACEAMKVEQDEQAKSEWHLATSILAKAFAGEL